MGSRQKSRQKYVRSQDARREAVRESERLKKYAEHIQQISQRKRPKWVIIPIIADLFVLAGGSYAGELIGPEEYKYAWQLVLVLLLGGHITVILAWLWNLTPLEWWRSLTGSIGIGVLVACIGAFMERLASQTLNDNLFGLGAVTFLIGSAWFVIMCYSQVLPPTPDGVRIAQWMPGRISERVARKAQGNGIGLLATKAMNSYTRMTRALFKMFVLALTYIILAGVVQIVAYNIVRGFWWVAIYWPFSWALSLLFTSLSLITRPRRVMVAQVIRDKKSARATSDM